MNKVRLLRHILTPALLIICFFGCSGGRQYHALLEQVDSLMATFPDSAYALLSSVDSVDLHSQRKSVCMRYELLRAEAQNKLLIPFTTDSVLREVVRYYDSPWRKFINSVYQIFISPPYGGGGGGEALKARYLLGCVYRDLHEAPIALLTWEDAIAAADTTSAACDYATLFRVYGQMASIYFRQHMPEKYLEAKQKFCHYALLAGDTLYYIKGLLQRNDAYLMLGDTTSVLENTEKVKRLYLDRGLTHEAAQIYPSIIHIALDKRDYVRADSLMQSFEIESGLFDEHGNIASSYQNYYFDKGRYLAAVGQLDSAEVLFRKLSAFEENLIDACQGLLFLFQHKHHTDSVAKYALLYSNAIAEYLKSTHTEAVTQADAMYDFEKQVQKVQAEELKAKKWQIGGMLVSFIASVVALIIFLYYKKVRAEKKVKERELIYLTESYYMTLEHLNKAKAESQILQQSLSDQEAIEQLSEKKAEQVCHLEQMVTDLRAQINKLQDDAARLSIEESKIVSHFQSLATSHNHKDNNGVIEFESGRCASTEEWQQIMEMVKECHPQLYLTLKEVRLSEMMIKICVLSRYGFNNADISILTGLDIKYVSNVRSKIAKETFKLRSAYELNQHLTEL